MNGCAAAFVYFTFILPASIALDFAFGTEGMLTVLGLIFGFCWLVARSNKAQQDDSAGAPDQPRSYSTTTPGTALTKPPCVANSPRCNSKSPPCKATCAR